jgi:diaminohydroxyphosphoribosylaminopyrimidine deaminase/5-amino-6-(5-phosphoribosylamino)uracil reductase
MFDSFDHECMSRALELAALGMETTDPNPRVGCVLAKNGEIIASGWHRNAGGAHAEIFALEQAGQAARGATAYVTLEPCSHQGRTGACADALIEAGVARVVCSVRDENPRVNGGGIARLEAAGIQVDEGLLQSQSESLNPGFFTRMRKNRPWVRVKLAQSLDGGTALENGDSQWISSDESRADVQRWRARSSAIMTGIGTVLSDDPSLNVRGGEAADRFKTDSVEIQQPLRIIVDSHWRTPSHARTLGLPGQVLIAGRNDIDVPAALENSRAELLPLACDGGRVNLSELMLALAQREINELQIEAGATLTGALLINELVDEILIDQAPVLLGSGARDAFSFGPLKNMQQRINLQWIESVHSGPDLRLRLRPHYGKD